MENQAAQQNIGKSRGRRQEKLGVVISNKMDKTVVVEVERYVMHPLYQKYLRRRSRFMAHDENNACGIGDKVSIRETRPLSRRKRWVVREIVEKASAHQN
ncbi:MAG TPA: 30S ribosomal protein S17 [Candidatus Polarisedimenticolia bacterium]|nr:30S ribosomal protein S17 [Candidatus Polarisedimenticolia bacterium]